MQAKYNGQAFITEYAEPITPSAPDQTIITPAPDQTGGDPVSRLFSTYHYLTRLSARLSANQETLDPVFVPAPKAPDVSWYIDISEKVDPLVLHGCSTQTAVSPRVATEFAKSHARFADLSFTVGYPSNWVLSEVTIPTPGVIGDAPPLTTGLEPIYVYAPQPVTSATLDAYFKGQSTPPMFVFIPLTLPDSSAFIPNRYYDPNAAHLGDTDPALLTLMLQALGRDESTDHFPVTSAHLAGQNIIRVSGPPNLGYTVNDPNGFPPVSFVLFGMLATDSHWQANGALYKDILDYAQAHLYAVDANTRDTLFLSASTGDDTSTPVVSDIFTLPLPDGWTAHTDSNGDVLITPANGSADNGPAMRLSMVGDVGPSGVFRNSSRFDAMVLAGTQAASDPNQLADLLKYDARPLALYGLPTSPIDSATQSALTQCPKDPSTVKATPFKHNGLTGQVALTTDYIAAVYAPDAQYAQYKGILQTMMNAYLAGYNCQKPPANANAAPSDNQSAFTCPAAPPARLQADGQGRVTPGTPDNLREAPDATSPLVAVLKAGETFSIVGGPICDSAAGIVWWEIQYQTPSGDTLMGWIAEGQGKTYFVEPV